MNDDAVATTSEKIGGYLTVALTTAGRIVEINAHRRAQELRDAQQRDQQLAAQLQQQTRAEAQVVKHDLRDVGRPEWWNTATVEQVAGGYAAARAYGRTDPELAGTAAYMASEIERRYGVHADQLVGASEETARAYLSRGIDPPRMLLTERGEQQTAERSESYVGDLGDRAQARAERATAATLIAEADVTDTIIRADGVITPTEAQHDLPATHAGWDDGARHEALADRLETSAVKGAEARTIADGMQGKPAAAAPASHKTAAKAPAARNSPAKGTERQLGR